MACNKEKQKLNKHKSLDFEVSGRRSYKVYQLYYGDNNLVLISKQVIVTQGVNAVMKAIMFLLLGKVLEAV